MDEWGARLQFAAAAVTHGLFASATIGLIVVIAVAQTIGHVRGDARMTALARAWAAPYVVIYVLGIAAGMVLEAQVGLNWSGLVDRAGNVVGAPLTVEVFTAFVAESTLLALWTFGWGVLRPKVHLLVVWGIVATALLSIFWALVANGFMQHPQGYDVVGGELVITDFAALLLTADVWISLLHVLGAALAVGGLLVAGYAAVRLRRTTGSWSPVDLAALRTGSVVAAAGTVVALAAGAGSFWYLDSDQPAKFATITGGASARADVTAELVDRYGPGQWLPPAWLLAPAMVMILLGLVILAVAVWGTGILDEKPLEQSPLLTWLPYAVPLPFVAIACGWVVREVGRQPWVVQGLLHTEDAVTPAGAARVVLTTSLVALLCVAVSVAAVVLVRRTLRRDVDLFASHPAPPGGPTDGAAVPRVPAPRREPDRRRKASS